MSQIPVIMHVNYLKNVDQKYFKWQDVHLPLVVWCIDFLILQCKNSVTRECLLSFPPPPLPSLSTEQMPRNTSFLNSVSISLNQRGLNSKRGPNSSSTLSSPGHFERYLIAPKPHLMALNKKASLKTASNLSWHCTTTYALGLLCN